MFYLSAEQQRYPKSVELLVLKDNTCPARGARCYSWDWNWKCGSTHFFGNGSKTLLEGTFQPQTPNAACIAPTELGCSTTRDTEPPLGQRGQKGAWPNQEEVKRIRASSLKWTLFLLANFITDYLTRTTREELAAEILPLPPEVRVTGLAFHIWQCGLLRSWRMLPEPASLPAGPTLNRATGNGGSPKGPCIQEQGTGIIGEGWRCQILFLVEVLHASNHPAPRDFAGG